MTPRQKDVMGYLRDYWTEHGLGPTLAEIGTALGVRPPTVYGHLVALERSGLAERLGRPGDSRRWAVREVRRG